MSQTLREYFGTPMQIEGGWSREQATAWLKRFYNGLAREASVPSARVAHQAYIDAHFKVHCTTCGAIITAEGLDRVGREKVRRCAVCRSTGRQASDVKYCRQCATAIHRPEIPADASRERARSMRVSWPTVAVCDRCKEIGHSVETEARVAAKTAAAAAKEQFLNGLSPKLKRRLGRTSS